MVQSLNERLSHVAVYRKDLSAFALSSTGKLPGFPHGEVLLVIFLLLLGSLFCSTPLMVMGSWEARLLVTSLRFQVCFLKSFSPVVGNWASSGTLAKEIQLGMRGLWGCNTVWTEGSVGSL